jgi:hypothetical protein
VPAWGRVNGHLSLTINPVWEMDSKTGKPVSSGIPYGTIPRLLLFWVTTEAIRTQSRRLHLGNTLSDFLEQLGLNRTGGKRGDITRLREQMTRLFKARISFDCSDSKADKWLSMEITSKGELWWDYKNPHSGSLFDSWIELGENFYAAITAAPVPVDIRALKALKQSPLALDLYAWATYTTYSTNRSGKARSVSWDLLHKQFGSDYARINDFRTKAVAAFKKIQVVYPDLNFETVKGGIRILPGGTAVIEQKPADKATRPQRVFPKREAQAVQPEIPALRSVENCVSSKTMETARTLAKEAGTNWDVEAIEREFYEYARKKGETLKNPDGAFIGFVKRKIKKQA